MTPSWRNRIFFRSNDIHGQLENDDVSRDTCHARSKCFNSNRPLYKWSLDARFQPVKESFDRRSDLKKRKKERKRFLLSCYYDSSNVISLLTLEKITLSRVIFILKIIIIWINYSSFHFWWSTTELSSVSSDRSNYRSNGFTGTSCSLGLNSLWS